MPLFFLGKNIHYNFLNQKHLIHTEKDHILIKYETVKKFV